MFSLPQNLSASHAVASAAPPGLVLCRARSGVWRCKCLHSNLMELGVQSDSQLLRALDHGPLPGSDRNSLNTLAILTLAVLALCGASWTADKSTAVKADRVVIVKSTRTLTLLNHGRVIKIFQIALGGDPVGRKTKAGDNKTPEGDYFIDRKNAHSRFHLALHISYPNAADRERARKQGVSPGGDVEIHGLDWKYAWVGSLHRTMDWTAGCIAVTNPEIEEIYKLVPVGTPVEIRADERPLEHTEKVNPKTGIVHLLEKMPNWYRYSRTDAS